MSRWFFESDPLRPDPHGGFLELPIASQSVAPWFYWRLAASKLLRSEQHRPFGSGAAAPMSRADLARKLMRRSVSVVSIDGLKGSLLEAAFQDYRRRGMDDLVIIGADAWTDRGLVPRTIQVLGADQYLFKALDALPERPLLLVSFVEIYNEDVFDLLDPENQARSLFDWQKVRAVDADEDRGRRDPRAEEGAGGRQRELPAPVHAGQHDPPRRLP